MKSKILKEDEIYAFVEFYQKLLGQLIANSTKNFDDVRMKYMKFLVKYILALNNCLESTQEFSEIHLKIYKSFININDPLFSKYFKKQLNKIFLRKGIYSFSDNFIQNILISSFYRNNEKNMFEFS